MNLPALEDVLKGVPIPQIVVLFGGLFITASIFNHGIYIFESFTTFIYGIFSSYVRIVYKDKKIKLGYCEYFILQAGFFVFWTALVLHII